MKTAIQKLGMIVVMLLSSFTTWAYDFEVDGLFYRLLSMDDMTVEVTYGESKYEGDICVPAEVQYHDAKFSVTSIGEGSFSKATTIESIVLPESIEKIGNRAFSGCSSLAKINLPNNIKIIGNEAFDGCCMIQNITLPTSLEIIGMKSFKNCNLLSEITLPASLNTIEQYAFEGDFNIHKIILEDSNEEIKIFGCYYGYYDNYNKWHSGWEPAFKDCQLYSVYCGRKITDMTSNSEKCEPAFSNQKHIVDLTIGPYVTEVENEQFKGLTNLENLSILSNLISIGDESFRDCVSLKLLELPKSVQSLGKKSFYACKKIDSISIPSSVVEIKDEAFSKCIGLKSLIIEDGNSSLKMGHGPNIKGYNNDYYGLFSNLPVEIIYLGRDIDWSTGSGGFNYGSPFSNLENLKNLTMSGCIQDVSNMFTNCKTIECLTLGTEVKSIIDGAFEKNDLIYVMCQSSIPPEATKSVYGIPPVFSNKTYISSKLIVPKESLSLYKSHALWKNFLNIEGYESSGVDTIFPDESNNFEISKGDIISHGENSMDIYTIDGRCISSSKLYSGERLSLNPGMYIITCNRRVHKILIK